MTHIDAIKKAGLNSVAELSRLSGVSGQTLTSWFRMKTRKHVFNAVLAYAANEKFNRISIDKYWEICGDVFVFSEKSKGYLFIGHRGNVPLHKFIAKYESEL